MITAVPHGNAWWNCCFILADLSSGVLASVMPRTLIWAASMSSIRWASAVAVELVISWRDRLTLSVDIRMLHIGVSIGQLK